MDMLLVSFGICASPIFPTISECPGRSGHNFRVAAKQRTGLICSIGGRSHEAL